ncbi:hypothetical protein GOP47_0009791 [Adiantum capillus-veneris]|uniref:Uncharacterized protein n=1 Tax=Adiantum capillus-veneris TaxID=13818 RepID=A0A9D4ZK04_ADICA|nr:hypothetical protein GOP47_0009791 [Adiantum capillus-veneris]
MSIVPLIWRLGSMNKEDQRASKDLENAILHYALGVDWENLSNKPLQMNADLSTNLCIHHLSSGLTVVGAETEEADHEVDSELVMLTYDKATKLWDFNRIGRCASPITFKCLHC